jgi:hypothetical protein
MAWVSLNQRVLVVLRGFVIRDTHPSETPAVLLQPLHKKISRKAAASP